MGTNPPPPPPPLPFENTIKYQLSKGLPHSSQHTISDSICQWTSDPELREACAKNNICLYQPPYQYKYRNYEAISQVGPTCGLVAFSMLLNGKVSPDELLRTVKLEGYSNNGEMFSCQNMANLIEKTLNLTKNNDATVHIRQGLYTEEIIQELLDGASLLVPYDANCNHAPCLRHGHTAHWALVSGIIIVNDPKNNLLADPKNIYILCKHGKSKYLAIWALAQLDSSNKNLVELNPKKEGDGLLYIIPEGGIGGEKGLRDQFVIIRGI